MIPDKAKSHIQQGYKKFLAGKGLKARQAQKQMIADVANYLFSIKSDEEGVRSSPEKLCVIEAGTGTGKTLAYLASGIPAAQQLGKKLIVSTATVTLQEQLVNKDLPEFLSHSEIPFNFTLAKGRGRYLCISRLEQLMSNSDHNGDLFGTAPQSNSDTNDDGQEKLPPETLQRLFDDYAAMRWNGEFDSLPVSIPMNQWVQVIADNRSCTSRACAHYDHCPYYDARLRWDEVDVLVCNHDLVLADLALGGGVILPNTENCIYIFDEAHHLADKALSHFSHHVQLESSRQWLKQMTKTLAEFLPYLGAGGAYAQVIDEVSNVAREADLLLAQVYEYCCTELGWLSAQDKPKASQDIYRFANGEVDEPLVKVSEDLQHHFASMTRNLDKLFSEVKKGLNDDNAGSDILLSRDESEQWFPAIGTMLGRCETHSDLWKLFSTNREGNGRPLAKWLRKIEFNDHIDLGVTCSPLIADNILTRGIWKRAYGIVLTSATLSSGESFESFRFKNGIPENSQFNLLKSPFNYAENAVLNIPENFPDPSRQEDHTEAIVGFLSHLIKKHEIEASDKDKAQLAMLVLFSSRQQMNDVFFGLDRSLRDYIIRQDDMSRSEAVEKHKNKSENNELSILFGLASFAEGLDLPGRFLTHVVIAKIPFAVPDDPLDSALSEWVEERGGNPFMEISLPAAAVRLKQACGRLIRKEEDRGVVTLLDSRVINRRYGSYLLKSLPAYRLDYSAVEIGD